MTCGKKLRSNQMSVRRFMNSSTSIAFAVCLSATAASCAHSGGSSSTDMDKPKAAPKAPRPQLVSAPAAPAPQESADIISGRMELDMALKELRNVDLFFAFNQSTLTAEARAKLSAVGDVLVRHPGLKLEIEGNCDERGTEAYNLILGQERADIARKYLMNLGAKPEQLATVSFGAERPKDPGHNDKAWQENRRDDVVVAPATK